MDADMVITAIVVIIIMVAIGKIVNKIFKWGFIILAILVILCSMFFDDCMGDLGDGYGEPQPSCQCNMIGH